MPIPNPKLPVFPAFIVFDGESVIQDHNFALLFGSREAAERFQRSITECSTVVIEIKDLGDLEYYFKPEPKDHASIT